MKKTIATVVTLLCLLLSYSGRSQNFTFINTRPCPVVVNYEQYVRGCSVCSFGPLTIPAGSSISIPICEGAIGMCVVLTQIGGTLVGNNHRYVVLNPQFTPCHNVPTTNQTGLLCGGYTIIMQSPITWRIQ